MPRIVAILDDTTESQQLGLALMGAIGSFVSALGFTTVDELPAVAARQTLYCPLTLNVPPTFEFWGSSIYQTCRDLDRLREIATSVGFQVADRGNFYLPIIWRDSPQGTLGDRVPNYAEIIAEHADGECVRLDSLAEIDRQSLAELSDRLLTEIDAPSAVYLVRFSQTTTGIAFDRLYPFPSAPALITVGTELDLFARHWRCISQT